MFLLCFNIPLQLCYTPPTKNARAEPPPNGGEFGRFKKSFEQDDSMGHKEVQKGFTSWDEIGRTLSGILKSPDSIGERLTEFSYYQKGQLFIRALFEYYASEKRFGEKRADALYSLLQLLYRHNEDAEFKKGQSSMNDRDEHPRLQPTDDARTRVLEFRMAWERYGAYAEEAQAQKKGHLSLINWLLNGNDRTPPVASIVPRLKPFAEVSNEQLSEFMTDFDLTSASNREMDETALVEKIKVLFNIEREDKATEIAAAFLRAYAIADEEEKRAFITWINIIAEDKKIRGATLTAVELASAPKAKYSVALEKFREWLKTEEGLRKTIVDEEAKLKKLYTEKIREKYVSQHIAAFEAKPSGLAVEALYYRWEYITRRAAILEKKAQLPETKEDTTLKREIETELAKLNAEQADLRKYLIETLGLKPGEEVTEKTKTAELLKVLQAGMAHIKGAYTELTDRPAKLVGLLGMIETNSPKLYLLYSKYLLLLDEQGFRAFTDLNAGDKDFLTKLGEKSLGISDPRAIAQAQGVWSEQYHKRAWRELVRSESTTIYDRNIIMALNKTATLPPSIARAFYEYLKTADKHGLRSEKEQKEVAIRVIKLYALDPLLAFKYIQAAKHLAEIMNGDYGPDGYTRYAEALRAINNHVDSKLRPLYTPTSPTEFGIPMNVRVAITETDNLLSGIIGIKKEDLSGFDYELLFDSFLRYNPNQLPDLVLQLPPGYKPPLLLDVDELRVGFRTPFPQLQGGYLLPSINTGAIFTPYGYTPELVLPQQTMTLLPDQSRVLETAIDSTLFPQHPLVGVSGIGLPQIMPPQSFGKLIAAIDAAAIKKEKPEYSGEVIAGSVFAGTMGDKQGDRWEWGAATMGSLITPTGSWAWGGSKLTNGLLVGATALAVPVFESGAAGYQQTTDGSAKTHKALVDTLTPLMRDENIPGKFVVVGSGQYTEDGLGYAAGKMYYGEVVNNKLRLYELHGGLHTEMEMLNFFGGRFGRPFGVPGMLLFNVEPTVTNIWDGAGGGAIAGDMAKGTPGLVHMQVVPLPGKKGQEQPLYVQMTLAIGDEMAEKGEERPQWMAALKRKDVRTTAGQRFFAMDAEGKIRIFAGPDRTEHDVGGGVTGEETIDVKGGKAGYHYKKTTRGERGATKTWGAFGYGEYGMTEEMLQLTAIADEAQTRTRSMLSVGGGGYIEKHAPEGFALPLLPGIYEAAGMYLQAEQGIDLKGGSETGAPLFKFIGFLRGLQGSGIKIGTTRARLALKDYEDMMAAISDDPSRAQDYLKGFVDKYKGMMQDVRDKYLLQVQINKDLSVEFSLVAKEEGTDITTQTPERIYGRFLWSFDSKGFVKGFSSIPLIAESGLGGLQTQAFGVAGVGGGADLFRKWFTRVAVDVGAVIKLEQSQSGIKDYSSAGWIVQGALRLYSAQLESAAGYRALIRDYYDTNSAILSGDFSSVDEDVRKMLGEDPEVVSALGTALIGKLQSGQKNLKLDLTHKTALQHAIGRYFERKKFALEQEYTEKGPKVDLIGIMATDPEFNPTFGAAGVYTELMKQRLRLFGVYARGNLYDDLVQNISMLVLGGSYEIIPKRMALAALFGYDFREDIVSGNAQFNWPVTDYVDLLAIFGWNIGGATVPITPADPFTLYAPFGGTGEQWRGMGLFRLKGF